MLTMHKAARALPDKHGCKQKECRGPPQAPPKKHPGRGDEHGASSPVHLHLTVPIPGLGVNGRVPPGPPLVSPMHSREVG